MADELEVTRAIATIQVKPETDPHVLALAREAEGLRSYALIRVIVEDADLKPATDDLSIIANLKKALAEAKAEYIKPIKGHLDDVNAAFATITGPLVEADLMTRGKILAYREMQARRQAEAEEINRLRMEAAKKEMELKGELSESLNLVEQPPAPVQRVITDWGTAGVTKIRKYRVVDFAKLPDEYKIENSALLNKVVKAGIPEIPGVEIYIEEMLRVTARK